MLLSSQASQSAAAAVRRFKGGRARPSWSSPRLIRRSKWRIAACGFGLIALLQISAWWERAQFPKSLPEDLAAAPPPAWTEILRPAEVFRLDAPEFSGQPRSYLALLRRNGGGRKDILEFGGNGDAAANFRLVIYRPGGETVANQPFFVELARGAAETGQAISHLTQPGPMATKFGDFEVSELLLARGSGPARECLGFRFAAAAPDLRIHGFTCGAEGSSPPAKAELACLIDRLELVTPPDDEQLVWFFAAHESTGVSPCRDAAPLQGAGRASGNQTAALGLREADPD